MGNAKLDLTELAAKVRDAMKAGDAASEAQANDGGSANLDCVVLCGLKRVREASLRAAGIDCHRWSAGTFHLPAPGSGQGQRRYAGVQAMADHLKAAGVDCYVHYQID